MAVNRDITIEDMNRVVASVFPTQIETTFKFR